MACFVVFNYDICYNLWCIYDNLGGYYSMKEYKYKISVIIPVYNVEEYLEDTILSVINQTIGFKENVQIILVNDGSPDNSEEICLKYQDKYPDNIVYVKQKNAGVSAARNKGLEFAEGKYINFLDSDDKWSKKALDKGYKMLEQNKDIDLVWFRIKYFEASNKYHVLDDMYQNGDFVTDVGENYQFVKLQVCSTLIRKSAIKDVRFNCNLKYGEDSRFLTEIIFNNMKVGIIGSCNYLYRKRLAETSVIQNTTKRKTWYVDTLKHFHKYLLTLSKKKFGKVIPYVQSLFLYDLQWRLFMKIPIGVITEKECNEYFKLLGELLRSVDDEIIKECNFVNDIRKLYILSYKYQKKLKFQVQDDKLLINNVDFELNRFKIFFNTVIVKGNSLLLYCSIPDLKGVFDKIYIVDDKGKQHLMKEYELDKATKRWLGVNSSYSFDKKGLFYKIDLNKIKKFYFAIENKKELIKLDIYFTYNSLFTKRFASSYLKADNYYVKYNKKNNYFYVSNKSIFNKLKFELSCLFNLIKKKRIQPFILRILAGLYSIFNKKEIWIVSDRLNVAGDNGEAFFDYLIDNNKGPKHKYFVISPKAKDFLRLKKKYSNHLISSTSLKYKILFINSSKIISAQADAYVTNPFGKSKLYLSDMFKFKFVFLQHGIIKSDLSPWLNINSKTIDLFITSSELEQQSICNYRYNFDKNAVKLTGLARYDLLDNKNIEKEIILMPTWRNSLVNKIDPKTGIRIYDPDFKKTEYFKFYNSLINDKKLLTALKDNGYKIKFIMHNNMLQQIDDFDSNSLVEIVKDSVVYKDEFNRSALMITDYSSVFFDFSYLRKPIVLAQFDSKTFFQGQVYDQGYYDHKRDGFGPVCNLVEETVDKVIKYINNDCQIEKKYLKRIDNFFAYNDKKNCERIYKEIMKLK